LLGQGDNDLETSVIHAIVGYASHRTDTNAVTCQWLKIFGGGCANAAQGNGDPESKKNEFHGILLVASLGALPAMSNVRVGWRQSG
jgi:hypothetical protein